MKNFLQNGQTKHFAIVEFWRGARTVYEFAVLGANARMRQSIIDGAVKGQNGVVEGKRCKRHADSPCDFPRIKNRQVTVEK